jgi:predicted flap endonuclease-1-like 5' DNA nuclease
MQFIEANWLLILLVLVVAALIGWYIFHAARRTRVTGDRRDVLDEGAAPAARNQALIDAPTAAAPDVPIPPQTPAGLAGVGEAVEAAVERQQVRAAEATHESDDLTRLKGVGPKLAAQLRDMGITRFAQIAAWDDADIDRVDAQLGRFQGRIRRDGWVEQARLLAAGDVAGFAARFGAIT